MGDPHALDEGTRLSSTVLRALAALHDEPSPVDAAGRRALWTLHGVTGDELSTTVLVAGFAAPGSGALATTLRAWAAAGQAVVVRSRSCVRRLSCRACRRCTWSRTRPCSP